MVSENLKVSDCLQQQFSSSLHFLSRLCIVWMFNYRSFSYCNLEEEIVLTSEKHFVWHCENSSISTKPFRELKRSTYHWLLLYPYLCCRRSHLERSTHKPGCCPRHVQHLPSGWGRCQPWSQHRFSSQACEPQVGMCKALEVAQILGLIVENFFCHFWRKSKLW